ncbi:MAG TPA: hypothetical protein VKB26_09340 [Candidatus Acidoferrales bacterium]|nr:hypothetical protein [Candidatus Acidoferrales bacterium]
MRKSLLIFAALCLTFLSAGTAHAQVEIFGGYSYLRPTVNVQSSIAVTCPIGPPCVPGTSQTHPNLNGWEAAGTFNAFKLLGVTADFSGNYGTVQGSPLHVNTYLFGPQLHFPGPISPFIHALVGGAHETLGASGLTSASAENTFATALGGGIDIKTVPFVSLRLIQIDDLVTRFGSATQHQPRASAGIVIHF